MRVVVGWGRHEDGIHHQQWDHDEEGSRAHSGGTDAAKKFNQLMFGSKNRQLLSLTRQSSSSLSRVPTPESLPRKKKSVAFSIYPIGAMNDTHFMFATEFWY